MSDGSPQPTFDAVLFDVDGTLVDSLGPIIQSLKETIESFSGISASSDEIQQLIGMPLRSQMSLYARNPGDVDRMIEHAIERLEVYSDLERYFQPGVDALRQFHRAGIKTALVTSKNASELKSFLGRFPGADCIDATVCSSDVPRPKPAPDSATLACERLNVAPTKAVMIGDSVYDLQCARDAGVSSVAVAYGAGRQEMLIRETPDWIFETPNDLLNWAQQLLLNTPCHAKS